LNLGLLKSVKNFRARTVEGEVDEDSSKIDDLDKVDADPLVVAADVAAQILRMCSLLY
jgi:hypothetical protein